MSRFGHLSSRMHSPLSMDLDFDMVPTINTSTKPRGAAKSIPSPISDSGFSSVSGVCVRYWKLRCILSRGIRPMSKIFISPTTATRKKKKKEQNKRVKKKRRKNVFPSKLITSPAIVCQSIRQPSTQDRNCATWSTKWPPANTSQEPGKLRMPFGDCCARQHGSKTSILARESVLDKGPTRPDAMHFNRIACRKPDRPHLGNKHPSTAVHTVAKTHNHKNPSIQKPIDTKNIITKIHCHKTTSPQEHIFFQRTRIQYVSRTVFTLHDSNPWASRALLGRPHTAQER